MFSFLDFCGQIFDMNEVVTLNPPSAFHLGGVRERLVQSTKKFSMTFLDHEN